MVKNIPWSIISKIALEDLRGIKKGKSKNRNKNFRKRLIPWSPRQVLSRATCLAEENGVCLLLVDPKNTSKRCPQCGLVSNENRKGEKFSCVRCCYTTSSGHAAARNIIAKTFSNYQEFTVPDSKNRKHVVSGDCLIHSHFTYLKEANHMGARGRPVTNNDATTKHIVTDIETWNAMNAAKRSPSESLGDVLRRLLKMPAKFSNLSIDKPEKAEKVDKTEDTDKKKKKKE